jgi:hypothetical protein
LDLVTDELAGERDGGAVAFESGVDDIAAGFGSGRRGEGFAIERPGEFIG